MQTDGVIKIIGIGVFAVPCINALSKVLPQGTQLAFSGIPSDCNALVPGVNVISLTDCAGFVPAFRAAAASRTQDYLSFVSGADTVLIIADVGENCGSGVAPAVAELVKKSGAVTVGIACHIPWNEAQDAFGKDYGVYAFSRTLDSFIQLRRNGDTNGFEVSGVPLSFSQALCVNAVKALFSATDETHRADLDYGELSSIFTENDTLITSGFASADGEMRVKHCVTQALSRAVFPERLITAKTVLLDITLPPDGSLYDISDAEDFIAEICPEAEIYSSVVTDDTCPDTISLTAVISGMKFGSQL